MTFKKFDSYSEVGPDIEYVITIGRRAPLHQAHRKTIQDIFDSGRKPIIVIGSSNRGRKSNGHIDPLFAPTANPLTVEQQLEQIKHSFPDKVLGKDYFVTDIPDIGNNDLWCERLSQVIKGELKIDGHYPDISDKTALHFIGKEEDKRPRRLVTEAGEEREVMAYFWDGIFQELGIPVIETPPHEGIDINLSATALRRMDLNGLTAEERAQFSAPDYIIELANKARRTNGLDPALPVTVYDLAFQRLSSERGIGFTAIKEHALKTSAHPELKDYIIAAKELGNTIKFQKTVPLKVATLSCNQTVYDYATNVANLCEGIKQAYEDGADILLTPELSLTGYAADDYHQWNKDNESVLRQLEYLAAYANSLDPNLKVSIGAPWHYADRTASAGDPFYNINKRPYNCQFTLQGGKIIGISAKSILADGPAEYEPRQFNKWPGGTINLTLPNGDVVPFGKPVLGFEVFDENGQLPEDPAQRNWFTWYTEQCAEGWPGVGDDLKINVREQNQARLIAEISQTTDLSIVLNPSASRPQPAINKDKIRDGLCISGSKFCGLYAYTNYLGSESGIYAAEGSQTIAQDGQVIHRGGRYTFKNVSYSSITVDVPLAAKGKGNAHIVGTQTRKQSEPAKVGGPALFDLPRPGDLAVNGEELKYEEYARSISLWLRDYLAKQSWPAQGYLISLSGGADSAYGAIAVSNMLELNIREEGVVGFFERFPQIKCKDEALQIFADHGIEDAIDFIKSKMLTCVYLPTDNSSHTTENAARTLVEGGTLPDGTRVKGIGGRFSVHNVQEAMNEYIIAHSGLNMKKAIADAENDPEMREEIAQVKAFGKTGLYEMWIKNVIKEKIHDYVNSELNSNPQLPKYILDNCSRPIPTWANKSDDIILQNYQARARLPVAWAIANQEGKIALVTSNASEAAVNYTTAGGDMHMGGANPIGGVPKTTLRESLKYFQSKGLAGLAPLAALYYVNVQKPTAELRKLAEGELPQTDEDDLGFDYRQSEGIERTALTGRQTPTETFDTLQASDTNIFPKDPIELRNILVSFLDKRFPSGQFKRVMSAIAPYVGDNLDPHASLRTTILGDHFKTPLAHLTLHILAERFGGRPQFEKAMSVPYNDIKGIIERSSGLKKMLTLVDCPLLNGELSEVPNGFFARELQREYGKVQQLTRQLAVA